MQQARRAEKLHDETDPELNYPLDYVGYRITGYRSESIPPMLLTGQAILPDLRLVIDCLTYSAPIPVTEDEPVESPSQLAQRLNVSTKTVTRWRSMGLRWRWVIGPGKKRKTIAFSVEAVQRFLDRNDQVVARAADHTYIDSQTRHRIIEQARQIAQATDVSLNQTAAHLAKQVNRAHQSVRLILEQHDREPSNQTIFANRTAPLDEHTKRAIARAHRKGASVNDLSKRFSKTRSTIYRAIRHRRAAAIRRLRLIYSATSAFNKRDADQKLLVEIQPLTVRSTHQISEPTVPVDDLPPQLQPLLAHRSYPIDMQQQLLTQFNYLKYKAAQLRDNLNRYDPHAADLDEIESLIRQAAKVRRLIVVNNLSVVLSVARRHLVDRTERSTAQLVELLETGTRHLIQAVDQYNIARDQDFNAYLTWSLMRCFLGLQSPHHRHTTRAHRRFDHDLAMQRIQDAAASGGIRLTTPPA